MSRNRLSAVDAAFLKLESPRTPMHIGALLTFCLPRAAGKDYLRELFADMRSQPVRMPPFDSRLARGSRTQLAPSWEPAPEIDLEYHLRHSALPYPGGERELGVLVARLQSHPMDLRRPLWECHLIEGLAGRRFAIYLKTHHAAVDGMGALRLVKHWLSEDPAVVEAAGPWAMNPPPARPQADDTHPPRWNALLREAGVRAGGQLRSASELMRALRRMSRRSDNPEGGILSALATPRSLFNVPITPHRRLATQLLELSRIKAIGAAGDATVNDVALAICGAALRRYLSELQALPKASLMASIPVGLARADGKSGNAVAGFVCPLATQADDPRARLASIRAITERTKRQLQELSPGALEQFTLLGLSPLVLGQMSGLATKFRPLFNVVVSNVLGSRSPLYFRGAALESLYPMSVLFEGYALNITLVGYADKLCLGFTGCRDAVPHLQRLAVYAGEALDELEHAFRINRGSARVAGRSKKGEPR